MGAGVADQDRAQHREQCRPIPGVPAHQPRRRRWHSCHQAAERVAGHGGRRGGLAPAHRAVGGLDAHDNVPGVRDGLARHLHGLAQRQRDSCRVDVHNNQRRVLADASRHWLQLEILRHHKPSGSQELPAARETNGVAWTERLLGDGEAYRGLREQYSPTAWPTVIGNLAHRPCRCSCPSHRAGSPCLHPPAQGRTQSVRKPF